MEMSKGAVVNEIEIETSSGLNLGKFKFKEIAPADALLDIEDQIRRDRLRIRDATNDEILRLDREAWTERLRDEGVAQGENEPTDQNPR